MNDIKGFIAAIENSAKRADAETLLTLLEQESGYQPHLSGSIIGFGQYHYKYDSGREGDASVVAFSPRKQQMVVYIMPGFANYQHLLKKLGKYKTGKSCLYINKLADIDLDVLKTLVKTSVNDMQNKYQCQIKV